MEYMKSYNRLDEYKKIPHLNDWRKTRIEAIMDEIPDGANVLDWGCGKGTLGGLGDTTVCGKTIHVDGYDLPEAGSPYTNINYYWQFRKHYDVILSSHHFEHVHARDQPHVPSPEAVREIMRWMGLYTDKLIVVMPNSHHNTDFDFFCDDTHVFPYNTPYFFVYLEETGWTPKKVLKVGLPEYNVFHKFMRGIVYPALFHFSPFNDWICVAEKNSKS